MKTNILLMSFLFVLICLSCEHKDKIFNGKIVEIPNSDPVLYDTIYGKEIKLDGVYTGAIFAYDSLLTFISYKYPDYCGNTFSINTGKEIKKVIKKGQGPNEFIRAVTLGQSAYSDGNPCMWIYDWGKLKYSLVNLVTDSIIKTVDIAKFKNDGRQDHITAVYILDDSLLLAYNQAEQVNMNKTELIPPLYRILNYTNNTESARYAIYNGFEFAETFKGRPQSCLFSLDRIKPDNTKLAMPMANFRQLNIMDIKTGKVTAYKFKDTPDLDILRKNSSFEGKKGRINAFVDDDLIYVVTWSREKNIVEIDVFDWDGNFKKHLIMDKKAEIVTGIALDAVHKYLYALVVGEDDEEVYCYDVNYLYK
jgi:hypothetical protein